MRLNRLYLQKFENLRDFTIDFDEGEFTTVIVGQNGSGKSKLLEAVVAIFRSLDLGADPPFAYKLNYLCHGRIIEVDADPSRSNQAVLVVVDGASLPFRRFVESENPRLLPRYVFGYYSGNSERLERYFQQHQKRFYDDLLAGKNDPLRPLFYARLAHSQFVLLAYFIEEDQEIRRFLREELWIDTFDSALFVLRQPPWAKRGSSREQFWDARGTVRVLLDRLRQLALAPLGLDQRIELGFRQTRTLEHYYLYLPSIEQLEALARNYAGRQDFFKALESTYISDLLSEVRIRVRAAKVDGTITFRDLSEGEQQLLMVLGLLRFTADEESLFLLDEPDTHLNPSWGVQYLDLLKSIVGEQPSSHVIMVTHNPLIVANLKRTQVQIMHRDADTGRISATLPEEDPLNMGVGALLTSDVYGLRSQLGLPMLELLDRKRLLAAQAFRTDEEEGELVGLNRALDGIDLTLDLPDPLYKPFVEAMTRLQAEEDMLTPILSKEQQDRQRELAVEILQDLSDKKEPSR